MTQRFSKAISVTASIMFLFGILAVEGAAIAQELTPEMWTPPGLPTDEIDSPDAQEVIERLAEFMTGHETLFTEAVVSYEVVQDSGQRLQFDLLQRAALHRPDRFHWTTLRDDGTADKAWITRGTFQFHREPSDIWGTIDGPPTIRTMAEYLTVEYDLDVPFLDFLIEKPTELLLSDDVTDLQNLGESWVEGHWTHHIAGRKLNVDFEVWVRKGDAPFPVKVVIVFTGDEGSPSYSARFRSWSTTLPDSISFEFTPPDSAERVELAPASSE